MQKYAVEKSWARLKHMGSREVAHWGDAFSVYGLLEHLILKRPEMEPSLALKQNYLFKMTIT